jgi:hypothetical protein
MAKNAGVTEAEGARGELASAMGGGRRGGGDVVQEAGERGKGEVW